MTLQPGTLSVTAPFGQALDRVKKVLFQPFELSRWLIIGFCAWLATLGEGGGFHGGYNFGGHHGGRHQLENQMHQAKDYVVSNLAWLAPLAAGIFLVCVVVWLVVLFLSSRGRFMFLHCVALNRAEVEVPWYRFAAEGNSLFRVRIVLSLLGMLLIFPLIGGLVFAFVAIGNHVIAGGIVAAVFLCLALFLMIIVFWVISRILQDFIVPVQFLRRSSCTDAWREFKSLIRGNVGSLAVYLLFRIALAIGIAILVLTIVLATCCIAGCLFALPYIGTVFLLPVLVFERAYSLHYLAQFGPDYDVFAPPAAAA